MMSKQSLRKEMMKRLNTLDPSYKNSESQILYEKFLEYINIHNINSVGVVLSMPHELNTDPLISMLIEAGVEVYNPICNYDDKTMEFHPFISFDDLKADSKNIRVPEISNRAVQPELIIVPGLIFSHDGYRIGYGGGFYDRYLAGFNGHTVSLVFNEQIGEAAREPHDIAVDVIITPTQTIAAETGWNYDK